MTVTRSEIGEGVVPATTLPKLTLGRSSERESTDWRSTSTAALPVWLVADPPPEHGAAAEATLRAAAVEERDDVVRVARPRVPAAAVALTDDDGRRRADRGRDGGQRSDGNEDEKQANPGHWRLRSREGTKPPSIYPHAGAPASVLS